MNKTIISIIVPVYNVEQYLRQSLDSLVNQTYSNIEIIGINDGSPDHCIDILNEYAAKDSRVVVIDKKNEGVAAARNDAMKVATGEYFMFVDGDDWIELNACERLINVMHEYNPDVVMFSYFREYADRTLTKDNIFPSDFIVFDEDGCRNLHRRHAGAIGQELRHPENFDAICSLCTKLFKGDIIRQHDEIRYIDNKIIGTYGDGLMNLFYYKYVHKAVFVGDHLYHYRKTNETSVVTSYKRDFPKRWNNLHNIIEQYIVDNNLGEDFREGLRNRIAVSSMGLGFNAIHADTGFVQKYKELKGILCDKRYHEAIKGMEIGLMPLHWKVFYFVCRHKLVLSYYVLSCAIRYLRSKK